MLIYNTLSRQKEEFKPLNPDGRSVGMYVCGPTVYGPAHIGHARTYICFDAFRRFLEYSGYKASFVSNITDVHDDIIKTAIKENSTIQEIAGKYAAQFLGELGQLKIKKADYNPRVSEFIPQIIEFIKILKNKGLAYESSGSVYFDVSKFPNYGKLSGRKLEAAKTGTRIDADKFERDEAADFALWKKTSKDEEHAGASWESPWGSGRPGWHIECSAMSREFLGEQFDIHGGGSDLAFPHHENEIAQSEAASGKSPFVKYWMHSGMLMISGQKMSKSLGNFITIGDVLKKYNPAVLRFLVLSSHYRSPFDYSDEAMKRSAESLERINNFISRISLICHSEEALSLLKSDEGPRAATTETQKNILNSLNDDFNTPEAVAQLFKLIKEMNILINENELSAEDAKNILKFLKEINQVFQFMNFGQEEIPQEVQNLIEQRQKAREEKDWKEADRIRDEIERSGFAVEDGKDGQALKRNSR